MANQPATGDPCAKYDTGGSLDIGAMLTDTIAIVTCVIAEFKSLGGATSAAYVQRAQQALETHKALLDFHQTAEGWAKKFSK